VPTDGRPDGSPISPRTLVHRGSTSPRKVLRDGGNGGANIASAWREADVVNAHGSNGHIFTKASSSANGRGVPHLEVTPNKDFLLQHKKVGESCMHPVYACILLGMCTIHVHVYIARQEE
jgi:hypothetical protein